MYVDDVSRVRDTRINVRLCHAYEVFYLQATHLTDSVKSVTFENIFVDNRRLAFPVGEVPQYTPTKLDDGGEMQQRTPNNQQSVCEAKHTTSHDDACSQMTPDHR